MFSENETLSCQQEVGDKLINSENLQLIWRLWQTLPAIIQSSASIFHPEIKLADEEWEEMANYLKQLQFLSCKTI